MKVIITRPLEDAEPLAEKLRALGHQPIVMPLLQIVPRQDVIIPEAPWQAICFTSANAPRAIPCRDAWRNLPVFTVGPQSKAEALRHGYRGVEALGGNVEGLSAELAKRLKPQDGPLLYITGTEISGDLQGTLARQNFSVTRIEAYDAQPCDTPDLSAHLRTAQAVMLFSPRSARLWMDALAHQGAAPPHQFAHFCLSANVARVLPAGTSCRVASHPEEAALLALLDRQGEQE
jgi:uroporphyrinogen-III synthase